MTKIVWRKFLLVLISLWRNFTDNQFLFETRDAVLLARLIDGNFFNIDQVMNGLQYATEPTVDREQLIDALARARLFITSDSKKPVALKMEGDQLTLMVKTMLGQFKEQMDIASKGQDLLIGFNPVFLSDALKQMDEDTVTLHLAGSKAPCVMENDHVMYLILPVNFNDAEYE